MRHLNVMADHANSLIHNVSTNICEIANSQTAKFIAGKRIFYSARASFTRRVGASTLAMNTSGNFRKVVHKKLQNGTSPGHFTTKQSERKAKRLVNQRKRRALFKDRPRPAAPAGRNKHYGLAARAPGENEDDPAPLLDEDPKLQENMDKVLETLQQGLNRRSELSALVQGSYEWKAERKIRLTAANFGKVCRRTSTTSCKKLVHSLVYPKSCGVPSIRHGNNTEEIARSHFERKYGVQVKTCGLVVDQYLPYLAASPDGLIGNDKLLEIKCPTSGVDFTSAEDAVRAKKLEYLKFGDDGELFLDENSEYHYQLQGQLHVTEREECHFYIYQSTMAKKKVPAQFLWDKTFVIKKCDTFWNTKMQQKLSEFYLECLLPEIASPRYVLRERVDDIREPQSILDAIRENELAKEQKAQELERRKREREEKRRQREELNRDRQAREARRRKTHV
ncbi:uncharacterized protein LOC117640566 [Thrips palmi]|uniref:Uncharacterized protein LOC117640566 n=1 Tax=Thrips palmi TaxID=161013 RepID=A0A6P8YGE0_THRPL|nr:uncharacterized protein LOC117640566 [Thrips palmi]